MAASRRAMAATMAAAVLAAPASLAQSIEVIATSGEWRAYAHGTGARRICFAAATAGTGAFAYITAWPKDGVRSEFSLKTASAARKGSEALVTVGREQFRLFTDADRAWVGDVATEARLIEAMKKGARMTVQVTAEKGAAAPEVYSLSGMTQALLAMGQACQ